MTHLPETCETSGQLAPDGETQKVLSMPFSRYAIFYTPPPGPLARFGAEWLGWDIATGQTVPHPPVAGLSDPIHALTETPRKYGLHGTLKPPFRLAEGTSSQMLRKACAELASRHKLVTLEGLKLTPLGRFLALTVVGNSSELCALASTLVRELDPFRASPGEAELARRRKARLSPRQDQLLRQWGYPYVMEEFRFHITLTGRLSKTTLAQVQTALDPHLQHLQTQPLTIRDFTLVGEDASGMFHEIQRFALGSD